MVLMEISGKEPDDPNLQQSASNTTGRFQPLSDSAREPGGAEPFHSAKEAVLRVCVCRKTFAGVCSSGVYMNLFTHTALSIILDHYLVKDVSIETTSVHQPWSFV